MSLTRPEIVLHPTSHGISTLKTKTYDVVVIGGGPAGEMAADRAIRDGKTGLTALLIEEELVGGECPYWACMPSKALLRPGDTIESAKGVGGARELLDQLQEKHGGAKRAEINVEGAFARRDMFSKQWDDTVPIKVMEDSKVDVVRGHGMIVGEKKVKVKSMVSDEETIVEARQAVVLSTGSEPVLPKVQGLEASKYWTPREAVSANKVPEHLIVIGGGAVGTELATAYRQLGSEVTLIIHSAEPLPKFEPEAGKLLLSSLDKKGVRVKSSVSAKSVQRNGNIIKVELSNGETVEGSELLIATGRKPRTTNLGLESIGLPGNGAPVHVDEAMSAIELKTSANTVPWLYAVGDTNFKSPLTHMGKYDGKVAGDAIAVRAIGAEKSKSLNMKIRPATNTVVPQVVFTDPQVAAVGHTLASAEAAGLSVRKVTVKMAGPGTFLHHEGYEGSATWIVEEGTGKLVGATFVGRDTADLLHASTVAVTAGLTVEQLWAAVPPFPTTSECYTSLLDACGL